jgi:hypothetical protein
MPVFVSPVRNRREGRGTADRSTSKVSQDDFLRLPIQAT